MNLLENILFRFVKIVDIFYVSVIYFFMLYAASTYIDNLYGEFDPVEEEKKSTARILAEIGLNFGLIAVIVYIARNIVEKIPYPFEGYGGYTHKRLKELSGTFWIGYIMFFFQKNLQHKLLYLSSNRFSSIQPKI